MIKPWKILSSRKTFKDPFLSVRTDRCQRHDGHIVPNYHVLEFTDWATIVPVTDEGNIVLIREYRHAGQVVLLGVPGGVLDPGETDPETAARRELREETGCRKTDVQALDPNEEIEVVEMPYEDFLAYETLDTQHALHAAALFYTERYFGKHPEKRP